MPTACGYGIDVRETNQEQQDGRRWPIGCELC
jgi:hypothetical protein